MSQGHKYQDHLIATLIETLHYFNLHKHELENILIEIACVVRGSKRV